MPISSQPQIEAARAELINALHIFAAKPIDVETMRWEELEKSVVKLMGGPFSIENPEHQFIAMGLAALFVDRLSNEVPLFWFTSTAAPGGAEVGFADALMKLSPFASVVDALITGKLSALDTVRDAVKKQLGSLPPSRLQPEDYEHRFDAAMVQVLALDLDKSARMWHRTPADLLRTVNSHSQMFRSWLEPLNQEQSLLQNVSRAPRTIELLGVMSGAVAATELAHESAWVQLAMPLLFIGAPETLAPLDEESIAAAKDGEDALFLFLETVPCTFEPPDDGVLGAFPVNALTRLDAAFEPYDTQVLGVDPSALREALAAFDATKTRAAISRFRALVATHTGSTAVDAQALAMEDAAMVLISGVKHVVAEGKPLFIRRLTRDEAELEPEVQRLRRELFTPRVVLAS